MPKKNLRGFCAVSNFVGPDLGPNYLLRLSADDRSHH